MKITKNDIREAILEALTEDPNAPAGVDPETGPEDGDINSAERSLAVQIYKWFLGLAAEPNIDLNTLRNPVQIKLNQLAKQIKSAQAGQVDLKKDRSRFSTGMATTAVRDITKNPGKNPQADAHTESCGDHMVAQEPEIDQDTHMHHDQGDPGESELAKSQLYRASQYAGELEQMIHDGEELDAWVQAKITKASDYLSSVKHYLQYKKTKGDH